MKVLQLISAAVLCRIVSSTTTSHARQSAKLQTPAGAVLAPEKARDPPKLNKAVESLREQLKDVGAVLNGEYKLPPENHGIIAGTCKDVLKNEKISPTPILVGCMIFANLILRNSATNPATNLRILCSAVSASKRPFLHGIFQREQNQVAGELKKFLGQAGPQKFCRKILHNEDASCEDLMSKNMEDIHGILYLALDVACCETYSKTSSCGILKETVGVVGNLKSVNEKPNERNVAVNLADNEISLATLYSVFVAGGPQQSPYVRYAAEVILRSPGFQVWTSQSTKTKKCLVPWKEVILKQVLPKNKLQCQADNDAKANQKEVLSNTLVENFKKCFTDAAKIIEEIRSLWKKSGPEVREHAQKKFKEIQIRLVGPELFYDG